MHADLEKLLVDSAIDPVEAVANGWVREILTDADLPPYASGYAGASPALGFTWRSVDGRTVEQVRPLTPVLNGSAEASKYLWPPGESSILNVASMVADPTLVLIAEGTRQALAAMRYAPADWQIVGLGGCSNWTVDGIADPDLAVLVDGRDVVALFDADLDKNQDVWFAAKKLGEAATAYGATSFKWAQVVGRGEVGLDDVLGGLPEAKRAPTLVRMVHAARAKMPAKPRKSAKAERIDWIALGKRPRPALLVTDDRRNVGAAIAEAMKNQWDRSRLFMFGDVLTSVEFDKPKQVSPEGFVHLVHEATEALRINEFGLPVNAAYDSQAMDIAKSNCDRGFTQLLGVTHTPFVRPDGTVCTAPGFDEASELLLIPTEGLDGVVVPDQPTEAEVKAAVKLLMGEWLVDFPFETDADKANALALVLTPFVRGHFSLVPLAVIDGRGAGVGKGLFADVLSLLAIGEQSEPVSIPDDRTEGLKTIHSYAREGREFLMLDEVAVLKGLALTQALTAPFISSRVLGVSLIGSYANRMTWLACGNNVRVVGDLYRRCYRIHLYPTEPGWADRPPSVFTHPDLARWTMQNRGRLLGAVLTLIRNWFAKGEPEADHHGFGFGTYEAWQRIVGGIVAAAGVEGFLANMGSWREQAAVDQLAWRQHLVGLWEVTKGRVFTVSEVRGWVVEEKLADPLGFDAEGPDPVKDDRRWLHGVGTVYRSKRDLVEGGLKLTKLEMEARGGKAQWMVVQNGGSGEGGDGHQASPTRESDRVSDTHSPPLGGGSSPVSIGSTTSEKDPHLTGAVAIDFETADADTLGQAEGFVRIMGWSDQAGNKGATADHDKMRQLLTEAGTLFTSGGTRFDLPAAAIYLGLPIADLAAKSVDTEVLARLVEPPRAVKGHEVDRYGLGTLGPKYADRAKSDEVLKGLKRRYKGFDRIPLDNPDYLLYCRMDAELTFDVAKALLALVPDQAYWEREQRVAGLAASLTARGLRVDTDLLPKMLAERRSAAFALLGRLEAMGFPAAATHTSQPWTTLAAGPVWDRLAGGDWDRGKDRCPITNKAYLAEYIRLNPDGGAVEAAQVVTEISNQGSGFVYTVHPNAAGRIHPQHSLSGSGDAEGGATGRWSTSDPNILGVGKRSENLMQARRLIIAEPGEVFVSIDLAGIDARAVAGLSGDEEYIALMAPGVDIHMEVAAIFFGERTAEARKNIKPFTHGIPYGRSAKAIAQEIVTLPGPYFGREWREIVPEMQDKLDRYFRRFHGIAKWLKTVRSLTDSGGMIDNGFGRRIVTEPGWAWTQAGSRQAQSAARELAMEGLFRLQDAGLWDRVAMFIHDEVVVSVPADEAEAYGRQIARLMSFDWESPSGHVIPIIAQFDGKSGPSWYDAYV